MKDHNALLCLLQIVEIRIPLFARQNSNAHVTAFSSDAIRDFYPFATELSNDNIISDISGDIILEDVRFCKKQTSSKISYHLLICHIMRTGKVLLKPAHGFWELVLRPWFEPWPARKSTSNAVEVCKEAGLALSRNAENDPCQQPGHWSAVDERGQFYLIASSSIVVPHAWSIDITTEFWCAMSTILKSEKSAHIKVVLGGKGSQCM